MSARYRLNTLLAHIRDDSKLVVGQIPYEDDDKLHELRARYGHTHLIKRGRAGVSIVAYAAEGEVVGERESFEIGSRPDLAKALLKEWLARSLIAKGLRIRTGQILEYVSERPESNIFNDVLYEGARFPPGVGRRIAADFDVRRILGSSGKMRLVVCVDVRTRVTLDDPLPALIAIGLDPIGRYVQREIDTPWGRRRRLAGRVRQVVGDRLVLDDRDEGLEELLIADAWLEPRQENFDHLVKAVAGPRAPDLLERLRVRVAERVGRSERPKLAAEWVAVLRKLPAEVAQGACVQFATTLLRADSDRFPLFEVYEKPQLVFDPGRTKVHAWNQGGLDKFGPYNYERFAPRRLHIAVICQQSREGDVEKFVQKLLDGIRGSKYAENGLMRRYQLDQPFKRVFASRSPTAIHYREAVGRAIEDATARDQKWDLALVQTDDAMHGLQGDDNPYLVTKVLFLAQQVPTQAFEWESIRPGVPVDATINNVGIACYAKVNGIPWLLPVHQAITHELVVGLGSYEAQGSRFGARQRYVGVATVFSSDGRYMLESRTPATPAKEYFGALLDALERVIGEVRRQDAWSENDPVRLVFHVFKDFNKVEIKAVKALMERLGLPHARFAFIHVAEMHPYMLFDPDEKGVGKEYKGEAAAPRGLRVTLAWDEALICLKGPKEVRKWTDGIPKPLLLKLHPASTFNDISTLARQVFDFSCLSWRSLLPSPLPITVLYADLVAQKLLQFRDVTGWSPEHILGPIGRSRWFL
jgi:hypothetical protein